MNPQRLAVMFDQHGHNFHRVGPAHELMMIRAHMFGDAPA